MTVSGDAWVVAGSTILVLGIQQWLMHRSNQKKLGAWLDWISIILTEFPPHKHHNDGSITFPLSKPPNEKRTNGSI